MGYVIGIDTGGTKTEAVLAATDGRLLRREVTGGGNPLDVGVDATRDAILAVAEKLAGEAPGPVEAVYAGIAGANHVETGLEEALKRQQGITRVRVEDDRREVLSGTLGHTSGCGMICGTGSSLSIILEGQPIRQVGGLGYLIDTGGSGYELGQAALKQTCRYLDGRGPRTVLVDLIREILGGDPWDHLARIYAGGRPFIASFARTVFEGAAMGDAVCLDIIDKASFCLAELTFAAEKWFEGDFPVVMTGGILTAYPSYARLVKEKSSPRAVMKMAEAPPVYGAVVEALWELGIPADDETRKNFLRDYPK